MTDWPALRDAVPGLDETTYLNSCSMGLPDCATLAALREYGEQWSSRGAASWHDSWIDAHTEWRKTMAHLVGARAEEIAWAPSVGAALGTIGSALLRRRLEAGPGPQRNEMILGDLEFPAAFAALGLRPGTVTKRARSQGGSLSTEAYATHLSPQSEILLASRVMYSTGTVVDVAALARAARQAGAVNILDDYQGLGQFPLDVAEVGCDIAVGGALKWLCGGVGSAWLYVRRDLVPELQPLHYGWWANAAMFDFSEEFRPWNDARRFEGGEINVAGLLTSLAAAKRFAAIGVDAMSRRVQGLAADLRERLADAGIHMPERPAAMTSAIVTVPRSEAAADAQRLRRAGIVVDHRQGMLRISPHYYNREEDNQTIVEALRRLGAVDQVGTRIRSRHRAVKQA
jgi:kynureninase